MEEHFFLGGWKTSSDIRLTTITAVPLESSKVFRISCTELVDADILNFRFNVDGRTIIAPLNEGGSVFIEGRKIYIEQQNDGVNFLATWEVVQEEQLGFQQSRWVVNPNSGSQSLIAAFEHEQQFVLSINSESSGCSNGRMIVFIDGKPVVDRNGNTIEFLEGSSIIGRGMTIFIVVTGSCSLNNMFSGNIKILSNT